MSEWWDRLPGETWKIALSALLAHKLRAALSTIGVIIGSASIVLVVTVGLTGGRYVMGQIEGVGSNLVYAELMRTGAQQPGTLSDEITIADMDAVGGIPGVVGVGGSRAVPMAITISAAAHAVTLIGVTDGFQEIRRLLVVRGRYFDRDELASAPKVCLVTEELVRLMSPDTDPVGAVVRIGDLPLTIVGVFKERVSTFGASEVQRESVLVPFRVVRTLTGTEYIRTLYARAADPSAVPGVTRALAEMLRDRHRRGARYQVENLTALLSAAQNIADHPADGRYHRARGERHRHHERHAGYGYGANARDRDQKSRWRAASNDCGPVPDRSRHDQRHRRGDWCGVGDRRLAPYGVAVAGRSNGADLGSVDRGSLDWVGVGRRCLRLFAGEASS
jgi:hypothetical protein